MSAASEKRKLARIKRKRSVRKLIRGTDERPRLCVFRSLQHTYAQLVSDDSGVVLGAASSRSVQGEKSSKSKESAKAVGVKIAELAKEKGVAKVVFDRNGFRYHGRVAAVAEGAREGGLEF